MLLLSLRDTDNKLSVPPAGPPPPTRPQTQGCRETGMASPEKSSRLRRRLCELRAVNGWVLRPVPTSFVLDTFGGDDDHGGQPERAGRKWPDADRGPFHMGRMELLVGTG